MKYIMTIEGGYWIEYHSGYDTLEDARIDLKKETASRHSYGYDDETKFRIWKEVQLEDQEKEE